MFPATDLTVFEFELASADGINFPSYFDGMIVYNIGRGTSKSGTPNTPTESVDVEPGFYFFYNPEGAMNGSIAAGVWRRLGDGGTGTKAEGWSLQGNAGTDPAVNRLGTTDGAPIIVYAGVEVEGELVPRPIMHIGSGIVAP